jgi:alkanesulfonate monooxygenase SsuD/methylene tetrahydromethanopterin reductase-like flavin-dependent oxidoreductase (luciferase family)
MCRTFRRATPSATIARIGFKRRQPKEADMDREGQTTTDGRALAEQLGRVGLWTRQLDVQPIKQVREAIAELEDLGWGSLWFWEVFGREALTSAALLLGATRQMAIASGIANIWARDPVAMAAAQRTLGEAYPGRFVLGIGVSHGPLVDARGHRYERPLDKMRS